MKKITDKTKIIVLSIVCVLLILAIGFTFIIMLNSNKENVKSNNSTSKEVVNKKLYGLVEEVGKNYIKIKTIDDNLTYIINTSGDYSKGDLVDVVYENDDEIINPKEIDIIAKNHIIEEINTTTINTTHKITSTTKATTTNVAVNTTNKTKISESELVKYVKEKTNSIDTESIKEKSKDYFITLVDFIFYEGEIKGKTFNELTTAGKAKVIYYALLADSKIDSKFPNYKNELSDKYKEIKAKLAIKYIDITTTICESEPTGELCSNLKSDLSLLKKSLKLTWDVIKPGLNYVKELGLTGITKLKSWYETFRTS